MAKMDVIVDATSKYKPIELNQGGVSTALSVFVTAESAPNGVALHFPSSGGSGGALSRRKSKTFTARAWGRVTGGGVTNYTASLVFSMLNTPGGAGSTSGIVIAANPVAVAVNNESENWYIESVMVWDMTSNKLNSQALTMVANVWDSTAIAGQMTSVDLDGGTGYGLFASGTFSVGFTTNLAYLDGFQLEEN